ncbi:MAG TPA: hypothetical protein EYQ80_02820, partial [Candidatus Poseidoniales archaeon]|nr:hypothetical protein [Candidatus Poseidoniales archaeon]
MRRSEIIRFVGIHRELDRSRSLTIGANPQSPATTPLRAYFFNEEFEVLQECPRTMAKESIFSESARKRMLVGVDTLANAVRIT